MEDYEYGGDGFEYGDDWIYVEDEFSIADELAEGQIASPGYTGTNHEISMESYDFDLYDYFEDLEYADDAYWDYGTPDKKGDGQKRKRVAKVEGLPPKRRKTAPKPEEDEEEDRDSQPMVYLSCEERNRRLFAKAPLLKNKVMYGLLPDWRRRFEDADGVVTVKKMPAAMKQAAEAQDEDTPPRKGQLGVGGYGDEEAEDEEGDWEDEQEGDEEEGDGIALDPEMLQTILREKLGAAGLEGADEAGFMQAIQQMMSGGGGDDAAGELANALLGKLTSQGGDEAVSGWLSREGVSLEDDDEASSVATEELPESSRPTAAGRRNLHNSPPDSAVGFAEVNTSGRKPTQMPLHSGSPTSSSKKRAAPAEDGKSGKKQKKVQFDVPPSESSDALQRASTLDDEDAPESEDPLMSESTLKKAKKANYAAAQNNTAISDSNSSKNGRKRKAFSSDMDKAEEKAAPPAKKKKNRSRELDALGSVPEAPSPAPLAKRTRSARNAAGK